MSSAGVAPSSSSSSSSSSLRPSTVNTPSSTPWSSPQSRSSSIMWSGDGASGKRVRKDSRNRLPTELTKLTTSGQASSKAGSGKHSGTNDGLSGFSKFSRTTSNSSDQSTSTRDQWWEHVLPPGQLAERLRKAQRTSSGGDRGAVVAEEGQKSTRKSILHNATPSERKTWTSFSNFGREEERVEPIRSGFSSTRSSVGSIPSVRSDYGTASGGSSSAEESPNDIRSPTGVEDGEQRYHSWDRSNQHALSLPHSITRSKTCRRSRVMGDNGDGGYGLGLGTKAGSTSELDERFRQWNSTLPFHPAATAPTLLRPFPSCTGGRSSPAHVLADTPEVSSEEEQHGEDDDDRSARSNSSSKTTTTTTTKTTRRITRTTSSVRSFEMSSTLPSSSSSSKRQSMPILPASSSSSSSRRMSWTNDVASHQAHRDRHVSFNQDVEVSGDERWSSHTIGRHSGRSLSMLNDTAGKRSSWANDGSKRASLKPFPTSASMEARTGVAAANPTLSSGRGRRMPCYSAPTSPRFAFQSLNPDQREALNRSREEMKMATASSDYSNSPDLALLSSFSAAQTQLASAGHLALTITRQLSVPLRPMLHLTVFLSVSSFTFFALAGFLVAGYLITAWDDVNSRGKRIQRNVSSAKGWCESVFLRSGEPSSMPASRGLHDDDPTTAAASTTSADGHARSASSRMATAPIRFAFAVPASIAYKLTPSAISESLGFGEETAAGKSTGESAPPSASASSGQDGARAKGNASPSSSAIPPRPPLSSLVASIFLTVLIALGAGLVSFFADRASSAPSSSTFATTASRSPATASLPHPSSRIPLSKRNSFVSSQHSKRQSFSSFSAEGRPYDVVNF